MNKPKNPVIEIPTVKWKEGGLLVARPSRGLPAYDQPSVGNERAPFTNSRVNVFRPTDVHLSFQLAKLRAL